MKERLASAMQLGLASCHDCRLLSRMPQGLRGGAAVCPRCGGELHLRKPHSIARTWALLITGMILYVPANTLPMMITTSLGRAQADTIMSGVILFLRNGSWGLALVIFTASILVPLLKFTVLVYLLLSVQMRATGRPLDRTRLYRITEAIGRWSMLDIYVVTILVALVRLGVFANVEAGPAAIYFAAVVAATMLAAEAFDPRLIWDAAEPRHE